MKFIYLIFLFTFLPSNKGISQYTLNIKIDTSYCFDSARLDGEFGFYGTTRYGQQIDTLIRTLDFVDNQEIIVRSDSLMNFRLVYIPYDKTYSEVTAQLSYFSSLDNTIYLDCYFFRKPAALLSHMENGDTLSISTEYRGISHAGMSFDMSEIRIIKRKDKFYYSRNDLPIHGDLVVITFPEGGYEAGFSDEREVSGAQLKAIRNFETHIMKSASYSLEYGFSKITIDLNNRTFSFISNMYVQNGNAHEIWEILK